MSYILKDQKVVKKSAFGIFNSRGFSLIEILVVLGIIALMASLIVSRFSAKSGSKEFVARLNQMTVFAWRNALTTNRVHMVFFNLKDRRVIVSMVKEGSTEKGEYGQPASEPIRGLASKSSMRIAPTIKINRFTIEGVDEMANKDPRDFQAWFFVMPNGLTQEVSIGFTDTKEKRNGAAIRQKMINLNPFSAQFSYEK